MADQKQHTARSHQNEAFASEVQKLGGFRDWQAVALFYAALHLVDAYLAKQGIDPGSHGSRNNKVAKQLPSVWSEYQDLYELSKTARYHPDQQITAADVADATSDYDVIKQHVGSLL